MPRVICTLTNASDSIDGIAFAPHDEGGKISEEIDEARATRLAGIPGFKLAEEKKAKAPAPKAPDTTEPPKTPEPEKEPEPVKEPEPEKQPEPAEPAKEPEPVKEPEPAAEKAAPAKPSSPAAAKKVDGKAAK